MAQRNAHSKPDRKKLVLSRFLLPIVTPLYLFSNSTNNTAESVCTTHLLLLRVPYSSLFTSALLVVNVVAFLISFPAELYFPETLNCYVMNETRGHLFQSATEGQKYLYYDFFFFPPPFLPFVFIVFCQELYMRESKTLETTTASLKQN